MSKKKGLFMKIAVATIILQVIAYTWVHAYWSREAGMEIAPTSTIGFYTFCGFEAGVCGWLKKDNDKKQQIKEDELNENDYQ